MSINENMTQAERDLFCNDNSESDMYNVNELNEICESFLGPDEKLENICNYRLTTKTD